MVFDRGSSRYMSELHDVYFLRATKRAAIYPTAISPAIVIFSSPVLASAH